MDNGSEFISKALDKWACENGVVLDFSRPGKPTDKAFIESFNGSFQDECLNVHWFLSFVDAREKIEEWRLKYNRFKPHSYLGNKTPDQCTEEASESRISLHMDGTVMGEAHLFPPTVCPVSGDYRSAARYQYL